MGLSYYTQEDIYDVVADAKLLRQTDNVTGKKRYTPRSKMALFVPGRIIHINLGNPQTKYVQSLMFTPNTGTFHVKYLRQIRVLHPLT